MDVSRKSLEGMSSARTVRSRQEGKCKGHRRPWPVRPAGAGSPSVHSITFCFSPALPSTSFVQLQDLSAVDSDGPRLHQRTGRCRRLASEAWAHRDLCRTPQARQARRRSIEKSCRPAVRSRRNTSVEKSYTTGPRGRETLLKDCRSYLIRHNVCRIHRHFRACLPVGTRSGSCGLRPLRGSIRPPAGSR